MFKKDSKYSGFFLLLVVILLFSSTVLAQDVSWPSDLPPMAELSEFSGEDISIRIWAHDPLYIKWFNTTVKEFNQLYPDINIEGEITQINPNSKLMDKTISSIVADEGKPDIVGVNWLYMGKLWQRGLHEAFMPLPLEEENLLNKFNYNALSTAMRPNTNEIYALPSDVPVTVLWYRKDIMEEENIEVPFETWDDYVKAGQKITKDIDGDGEIDRYMTIVVRNPSDPLSGMTVSLNAILAQLGGKLFDKEGNFKLNSPEGAVAAQFVSDLVNKYKIALPVAEYNAAESGQAIFKEGKAVTSIGATWYLDYLMKNYYPEQSGKWRAQKLPKVTKGDVFDLEGTGATTSRHGGTYMTLLKSPQQKLVWEFLKYSYASGENLIRYWNQTHYLPPVKTALNSDSVQDFKSEYLGGQNLGQLYVEQLKTLEPLYTNEKLGETLEALTRNLPDLIDNNITGKEYVETIEEEIN